MNEKKLLALVDEYQQHFGHRVPNWAGRKDTAEKIMFAICNDTPVEAWRDYRPNPQNFFALADVLKCEIALVQEQHASNRVEARKSIQSARMLVPKFSCRTVDGWHIQWPKDDPHVLCADTQEQLIPLLAVWLLKLGRLGNVGPHVVAENGCLTCK